MLHIHRCPGGETQPRRSNQAFRFSACPEYRTSIPVRIIARIRGLVVLAIAVIFHVSNRTMGMMSSGLPRTICLRSPRKLPVTFLILRFLKFSSQSDWLIKHRW